jgi:hypothetical protein
MSKFRKKYLVKRLTHMADLLPHDTFHHEIILGLERLAHFLSMHQSTNHFACVSIIRDFQSSPNQMIPVHIVRMSWNVV